MPSPLTPEVLSDLRTAFESDSRLKIAQNAITRNPVDDVVVNRERLVSLSTTMSNRLDDWDVTNQKKSGRCWLFSSLNFFRFDARGKLGLKNFELSQNYAVYWDKLERANYFLEDIDATSDVPEDDRLIAFLLAEVMGDGGQWNMAMNIYKKYGVVPKEVMPETESSSNTGQMNRNLRRLLRQSAKSIRDAKRAGASEADVASLKRDALAAAHRILTVHLGTPPTEFDWEWTDDEGKFHRDGVLTPQQFREKYVDLPLDDFVCLVDDPRSEHPKKSPITIEHLGNVVGGDEVLYLNSEIEVMKKLAADAIVSGEPVWFGCDVAPQMLRKDGVWAADLFDYSSVYGVDFDLDKEARVRYGDSAMTHAMFLTGVDIVDGQSRRWRVENSWGPDNGDKGFYTMDDSWFDEYVFEVAVRRTALPVDYQLGLAKKPLALPAWDPMGALARAK